MALFQKTYAELREAFVRARFAQEDVFGRPDIEAWLAGQRKVERPEYDHVAGESYWNTALCSDHMMWAARHSPLKILMEQAEAFGLMPRELPFDDDAFHAFGPFIGLSIGDTEVYYGHAHGAIIVKENMGRPLRPYTMRLEGEKLRCALVVESFGANPIRD